MSKPPDPDSDSRNDGVSAGRPTPLPKDADDMDGENELFDERNGGGKVVATWLFYALILAAAALIPLLLSLG